MVLQAKHYGFPPKKIGCVEQVSSYNSKETQIYSLTRNKTMKQNNSNAMTTVEEQSCLTSCRWSYSMISKLLSRLLGTSAMTDRLKEEHTAFLVNTAVSSQCYTWRYSSHWRETRTWLKFCHQWIHKVVDPHQNVQELSLGQYHWYI